MSERRYADQLDQLFNRVLEELQATPDEEILAGETVDAVKQRALGRLARARSAAGAQRLAAARAGLSARTVGRKAPDVSIDVARAYVLRASHDSRYTLAARQLNEMSEEDILSLYAQLLELEEKKRDSDDP